MDPLKQLQQAGLSVTTSEGKLRVSPASKIKQEHRILIHQHKAILLAALETKNAKTRLPRIRTAATANSQWLSIRKRWHDHIFSCPNCHPRPGRYCSVGAQLHAEYQATDGHDP